MVLQNAHGSPSGIQNGSHCDKRASAYGIWILRNNLEHGMITNLAWMGYRDTTGTQVLWDWIFFFPSRKPKRDGIQMETGHGNETDVHSERIPPLPAFFLFYFLSVSSLHFSFCSFPFMPCLGHGLLSSLGGICWHYDRRWDVRLKQFAPRPAGRTERNNQANLAANEVCSRTTTRPNNNNRSAPNSYRSSASGLCLQRCVDLCGWLHSLG